jgi:hypothetical protein
MISTCHIFKKAQTSKFKTKESEHTHHFMRVDLAVIGCFIILGVYFGCLFYVVLRRCLENMSTDVFKRSTRRSTKY